MQPMYPCENKKQSLADINSTLGTTSAHRVSVRVSAILLLVAAVEVVVGTVVIVVASS